MRTIRIYHPDTLVSGMEIELEVQAATHLTRVLRVQQGAPLVLFNGDGFEYESTVSRIHRNHAWARILNARSIDRESPLNITLCQGISKGERMDYTIQKSVELGVTAIVPLFTERGSVQLKGDRLEKRHRHWQAVATSACEQCGRNRVPVVAPARTYADWITQTDNTAMKLILDPNAGMGLGTLPAGQQHVLLLAGPEGGLSQQETELSYQNDFMGMRLGPRILRTETAAITALSIIQHLHGDLD